MRARTVDARSHVADIALFLRDSSAPEGGQCLALFAYTPRDIPPKVQSIKAASAFQVPGEFLFSPASTLFFEVRGKIPGEHIPDDVPRSAEEG